MKYPTARTHKKNEPVVVYDPNTPDYNKTPYAMRKAEKARALIAQYGLPRESKSKKAK